MRRVVYYGHCQMQALQSLHVRFITPLTGGTAIWINLSETISQADHAAIAAADLIVAQVGDQHSVDAVAELPTRAKRHFVPLLGTTFLWPFSGHPHTKNLKNGPYPANLGDNFLNRMIKQGVSPDEATKRYLDLDVNAMVGLDRLMEVNIEQQRQRDELTDYRFADVIADKFRDEWLYFCPYHPRLWLSRLWVNDIWARLDVGAEAVETLRRELTWAPFPVGSLPIHPSVVRHFRLSSVTEETRYRFPSEATNVTFRQYAERYMRFEWNKTLDEGASFSIAGQNRAALEKLRQGVEETPGSVEGVRFLVHYLIQSKLYAEALTVIRRALAIDPSDPYQHAKLAAVLMHLGEPIAAETASRQAIALSPETDLFHCRLSGALVAQGRLAEAEAAATTATDLEPDSSDNLISLAAVLSQSKQLDAAETALRRAISLTPRLSDGYQRLSRVLLLQGKIEEAIDAACVAADLVPHHAFSYAFLSTIQEEAGRPEAAEATLRRGLELLPQAPSLSVSLSHILERQGRTDDAISAVRRAIELGPWDTDAQLRFARLFDRIGQVDAAEIILRYAIVMAPQNAALYQELSQLLERCNQLEAAIAIARQATALDPPSSRRFMRLSVLLMCVGRLDEAEAAVQQGFAVAPDSTDLHRHLSFLLERKGELERVNRRAKGPHRRQKRL